MLSAIVFLLVSFAFRFASASTCVAMDSNFNLLVFGLGGKDFNAGLQSSWTTGSAPTDITTSGRPPFDGANTTCYLAQFFNAIYVLNADASNPTAVYIYDATGKSWSKQSVSSPSGTPAFDPSSFKAILDHDTNVFYALSHGELFMLDVSSVKTVATSSALSWQDVGTPKFDSTNYNPVMALAENHIHFLDVPGLSAGQADIFVIHFSFFQPAAQPYPASDGTNFPLEHGQTASFFMATQNQVQQEFAFIPDDGSATYVINVVTNSTQVLAGPQTKDPLATYFAGPTALVQLDSTGKVAFLPYTAGGDNSQAQWISISSIVAPPPSASGPSLSQAAGSMTRSLVGSQGTGTMIAAQATGVTSNARTRSVTDGILALLTVSAFALLVLA